MPAEEKKAVKQVFLESATLADAIKFARIARLDDAVVGSWIESA